jgi:hypothetical protein
VFHLTLDVGRKPLSPFDVVVRIDLDLH